MTHASTLFAVLICMLGLFITAKLAMTTSQMPKGSKSVGAKEVSAHCHLLSNPLWPPQVTAHYKCLSKAIVLFLLLPPGNFSFPPLMVYI